MKLSELKFKTNYTSYEDDIVEDFYNKAFSSANLYERVSAYFDSKIISLYSKGIERIYNNNGKIYFIFSQQLSSSDYELIKEGYSNRLDNMLLASFNSSELTPENKRNLSNLAYLIEIGIVDIKIAFTKSGILHDKFGLIMDDNDTVYFRGSNNETVASISSNYESFEVSCTWNDEENELIKIQNAKNSFERMWNNDIEGVKVYTIPNIILNQIAKYNKGKLELIDNIYKQNTVVADLAENNKLVVYNNLNYFYDFNKDYDFKNFIRIYVKEIVDNKINFKDDINYITMEKIISKFSDSASYNNYNFETTSKLKKYINSHNLEIDKRKELGKCIKKQDSIVINEFIKFAKIVNDGLERRLRDKQMWDSFFIVKMLKSANYSVPGAGKTSIVYGAFAYLNSLKISKVDKLIVIGPKNSFKSWKDEFYKCFGNKKSLNLLNIQDNKYKNSDSRIYELRFDSERKNLVLVNYEMLPTLEEVLKEIINERTMLVFDEVHKVKAIGGIWASSALNISKNAKYKVILTGTPIPNSYLDLYNQLNILFPDEYKSYFKFTTSELKNANESMANRINKLIYPFFCRTTKKQLNIPTPNSDIKKIVKMNKIESELFSLLRKKYHHNGLAMYIRLLQASTNPKLLLKKLNIDDFDELFCEEEEEKDIVQSNCVSNEDLQFEDEFDNEIIDIVHDIDMTSKFWNCINLVEKLVGEGKQVIVWGIFIDTIERLNTELNKKNINSKIIYGQTSLNDRESIIDSFKSKQFDVLVTNPHTLAESVSLHETCHDAIYLEYSFNLTHMLQSRDRINRLGLPLNQYTQYYYMLLCNDNPDDDSIDLKTYDRLKEKEEIMINSIEGELIENINFNIIDDIRRILGKD